MDKAVVDRLAKLAKANGGILTPNAVVDDAKDPKSPLHDQFEWDDRKAAAHYRIEQARELIRKVRVEIEVDEKIIKVPKYIHEPNAGNQGYAEVAKVRNDRDRAVAAMRCELDRLEASLTRAIDIADALGLRGEVTEIKNKVQAVATRLQSMSV